jgi:hypothetical protein
MAPTHEVMRHPPAEVYAFRSLDGGNRPQAGVIVNSANTLYGPTLIGANAENLGVVYQVERQVESTAAFYAIACAS